jgi:hypothetical protein
VENTPRGWDTTLRGRGWRDGGGDLRREEGN